MADQQDSMLQHFMEVTGSDDATARHHLEASNWSVDAAINEFLNSIQEDEEEQQPIASGTPAPTTSTSSSRPKPKKPMSNVRGFGDLGGKDADDDEEDDQRQNFFAGGEKSGLAVQNPGEGQGPSGLGVINNILRHAAEGGRHGHGHDHHDHDHDDEEEDEEEAAPRTRFTGSGYTLGGEGQESRVIPDTTARPPQRVESVRRTLTFWRDGFSVEDGPLYRYDDPANRDILQAIEGGRAPLSLMNVEPGQTADVNVYKRLDEDYVQPKKKFVPFSGQGQRLGDASTQAAISTPAPVAAPTLSAATSSPPAASNLVDVDSTAPTTRLQIRLGDGTRLVSVFNHTHTVGDVYSFVNASNLGSRSRDYLLQTTFPNRELTDHSQSLKDAGLINAVVVQKWVS